MKRLLLLSSLLAGGAVPMLAASANAATIQVNPSLTNGSFESSTGATCPTGWVCTGSPGAGFGSYAPTSAQYTPGSDGLSGGLTTPSGSNAAYAPTGPAGSGTLSQSILTLNYQSGNTYVFDFWVGLPTHQADGTTPVFTYPDTVQVSWLANGVGGNLCGNGSASLKSLTGAASTSVISMDNGACVFNIASPGAGQWQEYELTYTSTFQNSGNVGVGFLVSASSINQQKAVNFDIPGVGTPDSSIPEPATLTLLGMGLIGLSLARRRKA